MKPAKNVAPVVHVMLNQKINKVARYLKEHAPHVVDEQTHRNAGTEENAYWHYGYMTALRDIQDILNSGDYI